MMEAFKGVGEVHEARPSKAGFVFGYLKRPPEVQTVDKYPEVSVKYVFGEWSTHAYKAHYAAAS